MALITLGLLGVLAAPASAIETHPFTGVSIGPEGKSAPGHFLYLRTVQVDHFTGDVYVVSYDHEGSLYRFNSAGEPLDFKATGTNFIEKLNFSLGRYSAQIAIAPPGSPGGAAGDIYFATGYEVKIFSPEGEQIGSILNQEQPCGIATDAAGSLYVKSGGFGEPIVRKLTPTADPSAPVETGHSISVPNTCKIAVDSHGAIYLSGSETVLGPVGLLRLQSLDAATTEQVEPLAQTVALEPGTDDFYAGPETEVRQYASDGSLVSAFGEGMFDQVEGVAVAEAGGVVYVADNHGPIREESSRIDLFGPIATLPDAVAKAASGVAKTSAVLHGTINAAGGPEATCKFEYLPADALPRRNEEQLLTIAATGGTFTLSFVGPGGGPAQTTAPIAFDASPNTVEAALMALSNIGPLNVNVIGNTRAGPYRIRFQNGLGAQNLEQLTVDTSHLTGTEGGSGAEVQTLVNGQLGGWGGATSILCAPEGPFTGTTTEGVSAEISGLAPGTKYAYRLVARNANGSLASNENGSAPGKLPGFETVTAFTVSSGAPEELVTTSVTLTGSINPEGVGIDECFFEFGRTEAFGSKAPCVEPDGGEIGSGSSPVPVHAKLEGLTPNTGYKFRLVGGSPEFGGIHVAGATAPFETHGPPRIVSQALSGIGQDGVTVSGSIKPGGEPTTYAVEYVTEAAFAESGYATASRFPLDGEAIGSGQAAVEVSQRLTQLSPGTSFHVRLSASNAIVTIPGPDQTFRTQVATQVFPPCTANESFRVGWSALLPDCRAYEQASSPDKNGDSVAGIYTLVSAAEDGSAVTFYSPAGALPPAERGGTQEYPIYLANRDAAAGSWSSQRLLPPQELGEKAAFLGSTPDLRYAVVEAGSDAEVGLFLVDTENGAVTQIVPSQPRSEDLSQFGLDGISTDGSRVFFESERAIDTTPDTPAPVAGHDNLYLWERSTGDVSLVGVLPTGEAPPQGSFGGAYEWYGSEKLSTGGALNHPTNTTEPLAVAGLHAISPGGEQIFFTAAGTGQLYLRRGLGGPDPTTTYVSTPNAGVASTPGKQPAAFQEATPDGSRAFFISREKLTADANTGPNEEGRDLYRWDASAPASEALTDIAPDPSPGDPNGAEVQGLLGVSPSGTSGYFIARGVLAVGAQKGNENVYRFAERAKGGFRITFVAALAKFQGERDQAPDRRNLSPRMSDNYDLGKTSRLSEDGETLLFTSIRSETHYDNVNPEGINCEDEHCPELYLYSARTEKVTCVSCDPTGAAPLGGASLQSQFFNAYFTPSTTPAVSFSRNLSADGTKVFFQTPDPLLAADINGDSVCPASGARESTGVTGTGRCQDVYEWEAVGSSGSCQAVESNGGCLYLLSTGKSEKPSFFVAASKDASSAFIATDSQLVPSDRDQADDVYDARVNGGLASQNVTPRPPCDSAEACKGPTSAPVPPISPATSSFQGHGNEKSTPCKKGFVRKQGKCVKKPKGHRQKHHKKRRITGKKHSGGAK